MDIYTFYSESHHQLYEKLEKSIGRLNSSINLIAEKLDQECSTGEYMSDGWGKTMKKKVEIILKAIDNGKIFIHSDSDVIYLDEFEDKILEELGDYDIAFQSDYVKGREIWYCMGFFICKPSERVRDLFTEVYANIDKFSGNDQLSLNNILSTYQNPNDPGKGFKDIKYKLLSDKFFTYGQTGGEPIWNGHDFELPEGVLVFHANWTVGVSKKLLLMDYVLEKLKIKL